ncbi:hypothetical protein PSMK_03340 [Phycisphaera mikurensis NBRC 102666]|uniref:Uncharacterized protein n=1 Tax=Phycisphaera mikurensis (strain NBRC 102666 / KCTC 22515 / FYK2301M01) TaxID=1142394 RepID=I0IB55_PHYMF|nr:hypothetical protein PSMK_03340 [Phycisphaera mikurensis NBRC 102666]
MAAGLRGGAAAGSTRRVRRPPARGVRWGGGGETPTPGCGPADELRRGVAGPGRDFEQP